MTNIVIPSDCYSRSAALDGDLLLALYKGPLETPLWSSFLALFRRKLKVDYASLVFRKFDAPLDQTIKLFDSDTPRGSRGIDIVNRLYRATEFPYENLVPGQPFLIEELLDKNNKFHEAYLTEFLYPRGHRHMLVMRVAEPSGSNALLTISCREREIPESARACFRELGDHLTIAIQHLAAMEKEYRHALILSNAFKKLNFGSLTFDCDGEIIDIDEHAEGLLEGANVLRTDAHGSRGIKLPGNRQEAKQALQGALSSSNPRSLVLHLSDDPWTDILIVPIFERSLSGCRTPVAIGYVHGDKVLNFDHGERLAELFDLSRSEVALTLSMCNGRTIAEAAAEQGITVETARTYSKRIYSKTGTRGHADLVRLILASVIILA